VTSAEGWGLVLDGRHMLAHAGKSSLIPAEELLKRRGAAIDLEASDD